MQSAVVCRVGSSNPEIIEVPDISSSATIGADEVLCRTLQLGICGTDREILHSATPWAPAGDSYLVLGHECLARVEEVGEAVTSLKVGDLVVPAVRRSLPGKSRRLDYLPIGGFTERGIFYEHGFSMSRWLDQPQHLYLVPEATADIAIFTEPLAVAEKGVNEAITLQQARLGENAWHGMVPRVLVTGMGPIGFAAVLACVARGWEVTMLGRDSPDSFRATLAQKFGATYLPMSHSCYSLSDVESDGVDLILECTGSEEIMVKSTSLLRSCGIMVWLGSSRLPQPTSLNVGAMMQHGLMNNHLHIGCVNSAPRDFEDAISHLSALKKTHQQELQSLITARVTMDDSLWHYLHREPQGIKTIIDYPQ